MKVNKYILAASVVGLTLTTLFTYLLIKAYIGCFTYSSLILLTIMTGVILFFGEDIKEIDFKNKKLVRQIEQSKQEVFATKEQIKEMSLAIAETLAFILDSEAKAINYKSFKVNRDMGHNNYQTPIIRESSIATHQAQQDDISAEALRIMSCQKKISDFLDSIHATDEERASVFSSYKPIEFPEEEYI